MATFRSFTLVAAALVAASLQPLQAGAVPAAPQTAPTLVVNAADDCYAIGQQVAADNGGTLARASASKRGGREVCVIVVLVPGREGERPRRAEFVIPRN